MLVERVEPQWIDAFARVLELCKVARGDALAVLSERQSRAVNVELASLAAARLGARWFHLQLATPALTAPVPVRSTGASAALAGLTPAVAALAGSALVVDLTVEGLLHAPELPAILAGGARVLMVSNEHPEALERLVPDPALEAKVKAGIRRLKAATSMRVTSRAGTDLTVALEGARAGGVWGWCDRPGTVAHWPGGLVLAFPAAGTVNGTLVLAPGDVNLTFKEYVRSSITLTIVDDHITSIGGDGIDAALFESYLESFGEPEAYATSHVGWGMNPAARWEALALYDKSQLNGTELRAFAGNFLYSTGANEVAGRFCRGHFDLPMRGCTVALDGRRVVVEGRLIPELASSEGAS